MNPFEGPAETDADAEPPPSSAPLPARASSKLSNNRIGLLLVGAGVVAWLAAGTELYASMFMLVGIAGWAALRRFRR